MKKVRTFICSLLAIILVISLPSAACAYTIQENVDENIQSQIYVPLGEAILLDSEQPNSLFYETDLSSVSFGLPLNTYEYFENSVSPTETLYVPIFCDEKLQAFAHMVYKNGIFQGVELTDDLVCELGEYVGADISLIFDTQDTYLYYDSEIAFLKSYETVIEQPDISEQEKTTLSRCSPVAISEELSTTNLSAAIQLQTISKQIASLVDNNKIEAVAASSLPMSSYLYCKIVQQNGLPICWAAAVATIGLELTGISRTAEYVSNYMYGGYQEGTTGVAVIALYEIYNISSMDMYYAPAFAQIKTEIAVNKHPIYTRVYGVNNNKVLNHALVVDGYVDYTNSTYDGMLSVCDPNFTSHKSIYFVTQQAYPYTLNGITGYIDQFILIS